MTRAREACHSDEFLWHLSPTTAEYQRTGKIRSVYDPERHRVAPERLEVPP
jgi:aspartyl/asparaginyl beta-hydroxylase (cupin superfamily)